MKSVAKNAIKVFHALYKAGMFVLYLSLGSTVLS